MDTIGSEHMRMHDEHKGKIGDIACERASISRSLCACILANGLVVGRDLREIANTLRCGMDQLYDFIVRHACHVRIWGTAAVEDSAWKRASMLNDP